MIIPCLDEEPAVGQLVAALRRNLDAGDRVIVVDNGSRDRTAEVASAAGAEVVSEPHRGYGRACLAGVWAAGDGVAVFLDGDGADPPEDLSRVVAPIRAGAADLVVGSRRDREPGSMTAAQRFGNRLATTLIGLICGARVTDLGPMRAARRGDLLELGIADRRFGWPLEMVLRAGDAGWRIAEVPVDYLPRNGRSKVTGTVLGTWRAASDMRRLLR